MSHYSRERKHKVDIFDKFKEGKKDNSYKTQQKNKGKSRVKVVKEPIQLEAKPNVQFIGRETYRWTNLDFRPVMDSLSRTSGETFWVNFEDGSIRTETKQETTRKLIKTDEKITIGTTFPQDKAKCPEGEYWVVEANMPSIKLVFDHYLPIFKERLLLILEANSREHRSYDLSSLTYKLNEHPEKGNLDFSALDKQKIHFYYSLVIKKKEAILVDIVSMKREDTIREISLVDFYMTETGNCCGSMSFYGLNTYFTGRGLGHIALDMIEDVAAMQKSSNLLCVSVKDRMITDYLVKGRNYNIADEFNNRNTFATCQILTKKINSKQFKGLPIILNKLEWTK